MTILSAETPLSADVHVVELITFFEALAPADLERLAEFYSEQARFKDPFNEVQGLAPIRAVFEHMFQALQAPRFVVRQVVSASDQCFMTWDFLFGLPRLGLTGQRIRGCTHFQFGADGRITLHRDYWDAAEELYEKLPVLGALMRLLRRRASR
ncbi:MAG: nuclear transport factor 2 family protein [Leptothrix sp. (in: b-proteobacteria)]